MYIRSYKWSYSFIRSSCRNMCQDSRPQQPKTFETVFTLPSIKYISIINRLKVYHLAGTSICLPTCGALEIANIIPNQTLLAASYIGLTAAAVLCLATLPFRNVIGFLYVSQDNQHIKISSVDYWGKRVDRIIPTEDWIPMLDMPSKPTDVIFLTPQLQDGTKYRLLIRYGKILNEKKIGEILE